MQIRTLNRQSPVPLYHQLKLLVLERITSGELKSDDRLPAEDVVAKQYGVSKVTVRQALNELASAGFLRRVQGLGTFVSQPRVEQGPRELTSFTQEMSKRGFRPASKVLEQNVIGAEGEVAEKLKLEQGRDVLRLKRLRLADDVPLGIQTAYIPVDLAPDLAAESLESASLYEILCSRYGLIPAQAREIHFAVSLHGGEAELLGVLEGAPALAAERVTFLASGRPLELVHSVMRGDRYKIVLDLVSPVAPRWEA